MSNTSQNYDPIAFVRSSFVKVCEGDGCKAAALNHILYWIGKKATNETRENIQEGKVMYYATSEELTTGISNAWGVCKVRKEVNALVSTGLLGRGKNPTWGADRTKHFFFGKEQCAKLLEICNKEGICLLHIDLPKEIAHLIKSSNANDKSIKCLCNPPKKEEEQMIDLSNGQSGCEHNSSEQMMKPSKHLIDPSLANDEIIGAITKVSTKDYNLDSKDSSLEKDSANQTLAPDVASLFSSLFDAIKDLKRENTEIKQLLASSKQEPSGDTNVPNTPSPTPTQGPDTSATSGVRDNPRSIPTDRSPHPDSVEDITDVEPPSRTNGTVLPIAPTTTRKRVSKDKTSKEDKLSQKPLLDLTKQEPVLSEKARAVWDIWFKMPWNKIAPKLTETAAKHCEELSKVELTEEILWSVINYARKNDKNGFYNGRAIQLGDIVREYPKWSNTQHTQTSQTKPSSASAYTLEEIKKIRRMTSEERKDFNQKKREEIKAAVTSSSYVPSYA